MIEISEERRSERRLAIAAAKAILKRGDRIRATRCGGIKRTYTFAEWDRDWIVSASGVDDLSATCIDRLNGEPVDFIALGKEGVML